MNTQVLENLKNDTVLLRTLRPVLDDMIAFEEMYKTTINMTAAIVSTNATVTSSNNPILTNITNSTIIKMLLIDLKHTFNHLLTAMEQSVRHTKLTLCYTN